VKLNDQGTPEVSDDRIVGGAQFDIRRDDGNGIYEPAGADAPVLATLDAASGFAVFYPPGPGDYWVTEVSPPAGLDVAPPQLVHYATPATSRNCITLRGVTRCALDDDDSGGFVVFAVVDSPSGGAEPAGVTPPPTATAAPTEPAREDNLALVIAGLFALCGVLLWPVRRRPSHRR